MVPAGSANDMFSFTSLLSCGVVGKFSGKIEDFSRWRMNYILLFHSKDLPIAMKSMALGSFITGEAERCVRGALPNARGYRLCILRLEEEYGHYSRHMEHGTWKRLKVV